MTTTVPDPAAASPTARPRSAKRTIGRIAIVAIVLGCALLWIYALSGAAKEDPPNQLEDAAFGQSSEPVCAAAAAQLAELPRAETSRSAAERAAVIDETNEILGAMVAQLAASAPSPPEASARDVSMVDEWLADWETYLDDRVDYAERLRADEQARFYVTEKVKGLQITKAIDDLAEVNDMPACATPGDLG